MASRRCPSPAWDRKAAGLSLGWGMLQGCVWYLFDLPCAWIGSHLQKHPALLPYTHFSTTHLTKVMLRPKPDSSMLNKHFPSWTSSTCGNGDNTDLQPCHCHLLPFTGVFHLRSLLLILSCYKENTRALEKTWGCLRSWEMFPGFLLPTGG